MKIIKKIDQYDILFVAICMFTACIFALYRYACGDFVAYDGDFQNYNIFRRLLNGQVQYKDFMNYLGNGIVFVNYPLISLFDSFGESVFITNFTTSIVYSLIVYISLYTMSLDRKRAYMVTGIISIGAFVMLHIGLNGEFYYKYVYDVLFFEEIGHSMRTTRAFLPFMLVGLFYIIRFAEKKDNILMNCLCSKRKTAIMFFLLGILTIWSNDFGYSCVISLFAILILVNIFGNNFSIKHRVYVYIVALGSAVLGALLSITIITHGNFKEYFGANLGVTKYQFWYYGNIYGKFLTIFDFFEDRRFAILTISFFVHVVCFIIGTIKKTINDISICKLFIHSTCFGAAFIYAIGSGQSNYTALELITYIGVISYIVIFVRRIFIDKKRRDSKLLFKNSLFTIRDIFSKQAVVWFSFAMLLLYCISINVIKNNISYRNKGYVAGLDTYSEIGRGLDEYAETVSDSLIFSTYAGALETINNVYQPSGVDYIIHVLGDEQRERYLSDFKQGEYKYVQTLKNEYTLWEYWASRANWFFYRELYMNYRPTQETNYSVIWEKAEKNNEIDSDVQIEWKYINESTCRVDITLPDYQGGAYVDLSLKYDTEWTQNRLKEGGLRKLLCVQDGGEQYNAYGSNGCYYLNEQSEECFIPVHVRDGKGYVYFSSYPLSCTKLENVSVLACSVIKEPDFTLHVTNYTDISRQISNDGVDRTGKLLKFDNTEFNTTQLLDAKKIESNNEQGVIDQVWKAGDYIYVSLQNEINRDNFIYPNDIEVIEREKRCVLVNLSDDEWIGGVSRTEGKILLDTNINPYGLCAIKVGDITKNITMIELTEDGYCLSLSDNIGLQLLAYPQTVELIYE